MIKPKKLLQRNVSYSAVFCKYRNNGLCKYPGYGINGRAFRHLSAQDKAKVHQELNEIDWYNHPFDLIIHRHNRTSQMIHHSLNQTKATLRT